MVTSIVELNYNQYTFFLMLVQVVDYESKGLLGMDKAFFDYAR